MTSASFSAETSAPKPIHHTTALFGFFSMAASNNVQLESLFKRQILLFIKLAHLLVFCLLFVFTVTGDGGRVVKKAASCCCFFFFLNLKEDKRLK